MHACLVALSHSKHALDSARHGGMGRGCYPALSKHVYDEKQLKKEE